MSVLLTALAASIPLAVLGFAAGWAADALAAPRRLRDAVWSLALLAPIALAPLALGIAKLDIRSPVAIAAFVERAPGLGPFVAPAQIVPATPVTEAPPPNIQAEPARLLPTGLSLIAAYGLVAFVLWLSLGLRIRSLSRRVRGAEVCDDEAVRAAISGAARRLGVRAIPVRIDPQGDSPLLVGLVRPVILLPATFVNAPSLAQVFAHELAHLKRADNIRVLIEALLIHLFWFNPILRLIRLRLEACREERCDEMALRGEACPARTAYAQALLKAFTAPATPRPALAFGGSRVRRRLTAIVAPRPSRPFAAIVACGLGALVTAAFCGAGLAVAADAPIPRSLPQLTSAIAGLGERIAADAPIQIAQAVTPAPASSGRILLKIRVVSAPADPSLKRSLSPEGFAFVANPRLGTTYADGPILAFTPDEDIDVTLARLNRNEASYWNAGDRVVDSGQNVHLDDAFFADMPSPFSTLKSLEGVGSGGMSAVLRLRNAARDAEPTITANLRPTLQADGRILFEGSATVEFPEFRPALPVPDENGAVAVPRGISFQMGPGQPRLSGGQNFRLEPTGQVLPALRRSGRGQANVENGGVFALAGISFNRELGQGVGYLILVQATVEPAPVSLVRRTDPALGYALLSPSGGLLGYALYNPTSQSLEFNLPTGGLTVTNEAGEQATLTWNRTLHTPTLSGPAAKGGASLWWGKDGVVRIRGATSADWVEGEILLMAPSRTTALR